MGPAGRRRTPSPGARTPVLPDTASPEVVWQWSGASISAGKQFKSAMYKFAEDTVCGDPTGETDCATTCFEDFVKKYGGEECAQDEDCAMFQSPSRLDPQDGNCKDNMYHNGQCNFNYCCTGPDRCTQLQEDCCTRRI